MTDRFEIPLETSAGQRGPGSFGEKLGVAIALIALLGGAFILGGKLLNHDGIASASATPQASIGSATPQPSPLPTPRMFTVEAAQLPALTPQQPPGFSGWIRALEDLPVRSAPSAGANQIGALARGEAAHAQEVPSAVADGITWLQLDELGTGSSGPADGVVAATRGTKDLVRRYAAPATPSGAYVVGLNASADQFLAYGYQKSSATGVSDPFMIVSPDGRRWDAVSPAAFRGTMPDRVAYGPAGWLAIGIVLVGTSATDRGSYALWLWTSPDGLDWTSAGRMNGIEGGYPQQLTGNRDGYEMILDTGGRGRASAWHSTDGLTWTESRGFVIGAAGIVAGRTGFYAWPWDANGGGSLGERSADGLSWVPVTDGPTATIRGMVAMGDGLLAIDTSPVTGSPRVWMRARADDASAWVRMPDLPESNGTAVAALAGDGRRAVAFGWDRATLQPVVWSGDGTRWERARLPADAFGGAIATQIVANAAGTVAIGSVPSLQAENPVVWHSSTGATWAAVAVPELGMVGDATADHCPARPSDVIELLVLPAAKAIACFGRGSMTVRAWLTTCQGCAGMGPGTSTPEWLMGPDLVAISPIRGQQDLQARLAPGIPAYLAWQDQLVEITGHYDDPAATTCRYIPDAASGGFPISRADLRTMCRQIFVITRVRVIPGA